MEYVSLRNQISGRVQRIIRTLAEEAAQCQMAALIIAGPAGSIAAIAALGEIRNRMRHRPHSARSVASPCWLTIGPIARTGTLARAVPLAQSILRVLMRVDTGGFPGTDLLRQNSSILACAVSAGHPSTMGFPFPQWRAHPSRSAATCTICNGGSGNIRTKKRR